MFGIKKMLKDDDATGIVGAISACLPFSVCCGGIGTIITLFACIPDIIAALLGTCAGLATWIPAACCGPANMCCGWCTIPTGIIGTMCGIGCGLIPSALTLLLDAIIGIGVAGFTTCAAACGTMFDHFIACSPAIATCCTPAIGVCAAACSAVAGALGCSIATGTTGILGMVGALGDIISDMF